MKNQTKERSATHDQILQDMMALYEGPHDLFFKKMPGNYERIEAQIGRFSVMPASISFQPPTGKLYPCYVAVSDNKRHLVAYPLHVEKSAQAGFFRAENIELTVSFKKDNRGNYYSREPRTGKIIVLERGQDPGSPSNIWVVSCVEKDTKLIANLVKLIGTGGIVRESAQDIERDINNDPVTQLRKMFDLRNIPKNKYQGKIMEPRDILGLDSYYPPLKDITRAFKKQSRIVHPDNYNTGSSDDFKALWDAAVWMTTLHTITTGKPIDYAEVLGNQGRLLTQKSGPKADGVDITGFESDNSTLEEIINQCVDNTFKVKENKLSTCALLGCDKKVKAKDRQYCCLNHANEARKKKKKP